MAVDLELVLEERGADRVRVTLVVAPEGDVAVIDGASLQLLRDGEPVCPRVLVPIRGELSSPMATTIELRSSGPLPPGCRVQATAWWAQDSVQLSCPADPFVTPCDHVRGARVEAPSEEDLILTVLDDRERGAVARALPWIDTPLQEPVGIIDVAESPTAQTLQEELGLDEEEAAWLNELLNEPDP